MGRTAAAACGAQCAALRGVSGGRPRASRSRAGPRQRAGSSFSGFLRKLLQGEASGQSTLTACRGRPPSEAVVPAPRQREGRALSPPGAGSAQFSPTRSRGCCLRAVLSWGALTGPAGLSQGPPASRGSSL